MPPSIDRILVPVDFSAPSNAALDYAKMLAAKNRASIHLLHVVDDPMAGAEGYPGMTGPVREQRRADAEARLPATLTAEERETLKPEYVTVFGDPTRGITEYAATHGIDLIVMGTHGRTGLAHLLLGSVAERTVRIAPCAVLTVHR